MILLAATVCAGSMTGAGAGLWDSSLAPWAMPMTATVSEVVRRVQSTDAVWRDNGYTSIPVLGTVSSVRAHLIGGLISVTAVAGLLLVILGLSQQGAEMLSARWT